MNLGTLKETVILIDLNFLNKTIAECLSFYRGLYPGKNFEKIKLSVLLDWFTVYTLIKSKVKEISVIFAHELSDSEILHCEPSEIFYFDDLQENIINKDDATFYLRSFFADEEESCDVHFVNLLDIILSKEYVNRIIIVSDSKELNEALGRMSQDEMNKLLLLKAQNKSEIYGQARYTYLEIPVAYALGLNKYEV